jgi:hypothetical protein
MKQKYEEPLAQVVTLENKDAILQGSPVSWYFIAAEGDFTYVIEEDLEFL